MSNEKKKWSILADRRPQLHAGREGGDEQWQQ